MDDEPMLGFNEQITWLQDHGVMIRGSERKEAMSFLKKNNYFFKLIAFVKCFPNQIKDFGMLKDLSTLDMELRYILLDFCLDIEHYTKTTILKICTENESEDGYNIVHEVINNDNNPDDFKSKIFSCVSFRNFKTGQIQINAPFRDYYDNPPIWIILELGTFGKLRGFINYLANQNTKNDKLRFLKYSFKYVNKLRNRCAHYRELLNQDIITNADFYRYLPHPLVTSLGSDGVKHNLISTPLIFDIAVTLRLHKELCSKKCHEKRMNDFDTWIIRAHRHREDYYRDNLFGKFFCEVSTYVDIYK